jgi:hypothetical protein
MGVLETAARIAELGGAKERQARVSAMRAAFEARTGAFAPEDGWFEERSRAFWSDSVTSGRFGREVEEALTPEERAWLGALEHAHRGLFRAESGVRGRTLVDVWSGAEIALTLVGDESQAELDAATGQLVDARIVGGSDPLVLALLPGAIFHPRNATEVIEQLVKTAHARALATHEALDALLRMERTLRALSRVKATYAYRAEALSAPASPDSQNPAPRPVRRGAKTPTST